MNTIRIQSKHVKMIAHRGVSGLERENTCAAFVAAGNRSYYGVETDVRMTTDGQFVIMHDDTTDRVSGGAYNIRVEENTYQAIKDIVLPDIDGSSHRQDIRIPLLQDYIMLCKKYDKTCVLEVKTHLTEEAMRRMVAEIEAIGYLEHVIFISFCLENCILLRKLLPENDVQWLVGDVTEEIIRTLIQYRLNLDVQYGALTKERVDYLHNKGILVNCWTCDNKEDAERLVDMGVDFLTTDILE